MLLVVVTALIVLFVVLADIAVFTTFMQEGKVCNDDDDCEDATVFMSLLALNFIAISLFVGSIRLFNDPTFECIQSEESTDERITLICEGYEDAK